MGIWWVENGGFWKLLRTPKPHFRKSQSLPNTSSRFLILEKSPITFKSLLPNKGLIYPNSFPIKSTASWGFLCTWNINYCLPDSLVQHAWCKMDWLGDARLLTGTVLKFRYFLCNYGYDTVLLWSIHLYTFLSLFPLSGSVCSKLMLDWNIYAFKCYRKIIKPLIFFWRRLIFMSFLLSSTAREGKLS